MAMPTNVAPMFGRCKGCDVVIDATTMHRRFSRTRCAPCQRAQWKAAEKASGARRAMKAVARAIASGRLRKPTEFACADCGVPATAYDHRDYERPLEVEPVCGSCNQKRGPALQAVTKDRRNTFWQRLQEAA